MKMIIYNKLDIDYDLAYCAHRNTSFSPEKRATGVISEYLSEMKSICDEFVKFATDENRKDIISDLESYKTGYISKLSTYLHSHSRVVSPMVVGPAKFPTATNEKRFNASDRKRDEWLSWCKNFRDRMRRKYDPVIIANAPIRSDDSDATAKLTAKIEQAEKLQGLMKAVNRIIRKKQTQEVTVEQLADLGLSEKTVAQLLIPDYMGKVGFPSYKLTNNSANIRRMRKRLEQLQVEQQRKPTDDKVVNEIIIRENTEIHRLQILFQDKPNRKMRELLKSHGFRWAPSQGAWQRLLNNNARRAVEIMLEKQEDLK